MLTLEIAVGVIIVALGLMAIFAWPHIVAAGVALVVIGTFCVVAPTIAVVLAGLAVPCAIGLWLEERSLNRMSEEVRRATVEEQRAKDGVRVARS